MNWDLAIQMVSKAERWGRKAGSITAKGERIIKGKRAGKSSTNSGPVGKRKTRWYAGRYGQRAPVRKK